MSTREISIAGAGLVGSLLATRLAQHGIRVHLFERRPDPRQAGFSGGRSINLALSERGLGALRSVDLEEAVLDQAVMMRGRMIHDSDGHTSLQRYGIDDKEVNWSVSRGRLNMQLLDAAEAAGVRVHFAQTLVGARFGRRVDLRFEDSDGRQHTHETGCVIGTDGAGSALREAMDQRCALGERIEALSHGYKELEIHAITSCSNDTFEDKFSMDPFALHIWPRGGYMCIALPNRDGSYTVTLFLPHADHTPSFAQLDTAKAARVMFEQDFPDALALMPDFDENFSRNPVGQLATLYLQHWNLGHQALLIGDASHAIVPFHGQGMNAGFEDVALLAPLLIGAGADFGQVLQSFGTQRKPDADAIAAMALENYVEMRDAVADPHYLLKRELGQHLAEHCPQHFMPRYRMVTFTHLAYRECLERGRQQTALMEQMLAGRHNLVGFDFDAAVRRIRDALPCLPPCVET